MENRLKAASRRSADDIAELFKRNIERIDSNTKAVADLKKRGEELDKKVVSALEESEARAIERETNMERRITETLTRRLDEAANTTTISTRAAVANVATQPLSSTQQARREASYHLCRRSLKAWPVQGEDLVDAFKVFLGQVVGLSDATISSLGQISVARRPGKVAEQKLEVLATFETREDRDLVKAAGPNLAGKTGVGLMIHVPGHLLDNLHALNNVGYYIKQHNEGVRRNVKFDDENLDIFMDIKIGEQWRKITPAEAKLACNAAPKDAERISRNLSVEDLSTLVQGGYVAGVNAQAVPADEE